MDSAMRAENRTTIPRLSAPRVLCGIDAGGADQAVVDTACDLAGRRGRVALVCVISPFDAGTTAQATIAPRRATEAIERAMRQTRDSGVPSSAHLMRSANTADALVRAAADADVLVVGTHGHSRAGGMALGSVATHAIRRATVPVLAVRQGPAALRGRLLVASDGSTYSDFVCHLAATLGARFELPVALINIAGGDGESDSHVVARQTVSLTETTGREPTVLAEPGDPADAIVEAATATASSLAIVGARDVTGARAVGSVSERVAHRAPCSVLVARPGAVSSPARPARPTTI